jgi:hypothetical protein
MSMTAPGPRGWTPGQTSTRFADVAPSSYDEKNHTADCCISMGSPVKRFYGVEVLRVTTAAVDLDRMKGGSMIAVLDSHQGVGIHNALGRISKTWFKGGGLMGTIVFNQTPNGMLAEGMIKRNEICGISAGYCVNEWEISDEDGRIIDPDVERIRWDESGLTFTASKWSLHEVSLVTVPADPLSGIRSMGTGLDRASASVGGYRFGDVRQRMLSRHLMATRARMVAAQAAIGKYHD